MMPLVEVVKGDQTTEATLGYLVDLARRWGKTPIVTRDTPGFIVNRVARPFYGEALRLLDHEIADAVTIDRVVKASGFKMGPFELLDLIGLDVNLDVTRSMTPTSRNPGFSLILYSSAWWMPVYWAVNRDAVFTNIQPKFDIAVLTAPSLSTYYNERNTNRFVQRCAQPSPISISRTQYMRGTPDRRVNDWG